MLRQFGLGTFGKDLNYSARGLLRAPAFSAVAILTLAIAIAANTTVFSWLDAVLLRPLPGIPESERLVAFESLDERGSFLSTAYFDYRDHNDNLRLVTGIAGSMQPIAFQLGDSDNPQRAWGELVSANYFQVLGVRPVVGRAFPPQEYGEKDLAAVISYRLWQGRFHGDPSIAGKTIRANRRDLIVVGVAPPEFGGCQNGLAFDIWVPIALGPQLKQIDEGALKNRRSRGILGVARLRPGVTVEQANTEAAAFGRQLALRFPQTNAGVVSAMLPLEKAHSGARALMTEPLRILMIMGLVVLLIACANVANLLLARATARQKELTLRLALGANRKRLIRQMLTEALLLSALAALVGIPLSRYAQTALHYLAPPTELPVSIGSTLSVSIFLFTVLVCVVAAVLSGLAPALLLSRTSLIDPLKESGRGGSASTHSHRLRDLLVVGEVALALVAIASAALFARSFQLASAIQPGFDPANVLVSKFYLSPSGYSEPEQRMQFCRRLSERLASTQGVTGAGFAESIPLGFTGGPGCRLEFDGYVPTLGEDMGIGRNMVSPGFFRMMRMPLLAGREFTEHDDVNAAPVMVVNETLVRRYLGGRDPIGQRVRAWGLPFTVVGLVKDSKYRTMNEPPTPFFYVPFLQIYPVKSGYDRGVGFYFRTTGDPRSSTAMLRRAVEDVDSAVGVYDASALREYITASLFAQKLAGRLLSALGLISLVLAAVGLYSVMAYSVSQRTHEIGIRMALGGQRGNIMGMVMGKGLRLALTGLLAGLAVSAGVSRLLAGMLVNVSATDPVILAGAAVFLTLVAMLASLLPARRATRVDPLTALHCD
jgi:predicted permease